MGSRAFSGHCATSQRSIDSSTQEPGDAAAGLQLPLPRAQARGHRGQRGLHQEGVEDATEPAQNICPQCKWQYSVLCIVANNVAILYYLHSKHFMSIFAGIAA